MVTVTRTEQTAGLERLEGLYRANVRRVHGFVHNRVGPDAAVDIVAEVFHAAAVATREGHVDELTPAWLMAVARNKIADHWRRAYVRKAKAHLVRARGDDLVSFPEDWASDPRREHVLAALDRLPARDRALLVLHHVDGMPVAELADVLGKSVAAVESALARARRRFREYYPGGGA